MADTEEKIITLRIPNELHLLCKEKLPRTSARTFQALVIGWLEEWTSGHKREPQAKEVDKHAKFHAMLSEVLDSPDKEIARNAEAWVVSIFKLAKRSGKGRA